jgi:hypothetical protein
MYDRLHIGRFVTITVDTKANQEIMKALYSSLKTTSDQIDVSVQQLILLHPLDNDLTLCLCRHWLNTLRIRINS